MGDDRGEGLFLDILLVEDNRADLNMLRENFEESSMANKLHVVNDGDQAMDFLYSKGQSAAAPRPDLVLLDIGQSRKSCISQPVHREQLFEVVKTIEDFWFGIVKLPPE